MKKYDMARQEKRIKELSRDLEEATAENQAGARIFGAKPGEPLIFAYIVYESRERRDEVNPKVFADPRMKDICPGLNPDAKLSLVRSA